MTRYALKRIADDSVIRFAEFDEAPPILAEAKGLVWVESPIIVVEPETQYKTQFTSLEYLDLFSDEEQLTVVTATLQNAQVKLWYDKMLAASYVDITDPRTVGGLDALVKFGLLTDKRKAEILKPQVI